MDFDGKHLLIFWTVFYYRAVKSDKNKEDPDDEETNSIDAFWEQGES